MRQHGESDGCDGKARDRFRPIADIRRISDAPVVTRFAPPVSSARIVAVVGFILWAFAAIYALQIVLSGFVNWAAPNVYVSALVVVLGLTLNGLLYRRAGTLRRPSLVKLALTSIALSAIIAGTFTYMAIGP